MGILDLFSLKGKNALVTGSGQGLGAGRGQGFLVRGGGEGPGEQAGSEDDEEPGTGHGTSWDRRGPVRGQARGRREGWKGPESIRRPPPPLRRRLGIAHPKVRNNLSHVNG